MAETRQINLEVNTNAVPLKRQLKEATIELQQMADKFGLSSKEAQAAARKVAELKDRIGDAKTMSDAFNPDKKFQAFSGALNGVAGGFSAVTGAMGLVGVESEKVQQMMLKVQSAMALSQGLNALTQAKDQFKVLGTVITQFIEKLIVKKTVETESLVVTEASTVAQGAQTVATEAQAVATTEATVAQQGLNTAMRANPIGVAIAALAALAAAIAYFASNTGEASKAQKELADKQKAQAEESKKSREFVAKESAEFVGLISQLKATNQGSEERAVLIKKINSTYGTTLKNITDEATFQSQLNAELKAYLEYQRQKYALTKNEEKITKNLEKQEQLRKDLAKANQMLSMAEADYQKLAKSTDALGLGTKQDAIDKAKKKVQGLELELSNAEKRLISYGGAANDANTKIAALTEGGKKYTTSTESAGKATAKTTEDINNAGDAYNKYAEALEADRQKRITDAREKELQEAANAYEQLAGLAKKAGQDTTAIEEQYLQDTIAINKKYNKLRDDKLMEDMKASDEKLLEEQMRNKEIEVALLEDDLAKKEGIRKLAWMKEAADLQKKLDDGLITQDQYQKLSRANTKAYNEGVTQDTKEELQKQIEAEKAAYEQKASIQERYIDIAVQASNLVKDLFGKSKAVQKTAVIVESAAGIAKMIIANKLANIGALATPQAIASSGASAVPVITANNISTGLGIAANIAATAKALKEIGGGGSAPSAPSTAGGGGTSGGAGGGGVMAPNFNVVGNNGLNQLAQLQQQPIKAYVVGSEVTTQQALDRNRIQNGTL